MSTPKPEKILGKKFVRGKPYYKIKWEGSAKDQSSWQSPASLKHFKQMINRYEIKNWGAPLDDKFFDPQLYLTKGFVSRKPIHDKKKAIQKKKQDKKKIEEPEQSLSEPSNSGAESQSEQEQIVKVKKQDKSQYKSIQEPSQPRKIKVSSNLNSSKEELQIIDLDSDLQSSKEKQKLKANQLKEIKQIKASLEVSSINEKVIEITQRKITKQVSSIIVMAQLDKDPIPSLISDAQACDIMNPIQKDLGLQLPPKSGTDQAERERERERSRPNKPVERNLRCTSAVSLEIEPVKIIHQIAHIYHLEKMNMGNHLYLVQFQNKQMKKLTTDEMLESHPDELVSFLEHRFRAKCMI